MDPLIELTLYSVAIVLVSLVGGKIPSWLELTHTRMQVLSSFIGGLMLGIGLLHLFPHATEFIGASAAASAALLGFLLMFLVERFFCYHHHDTQCVHDITWAGAGIGLSVHCLMSGVALASSVLSGVAGFGTFLAIACHRPFESMMILSLMERSSSWSSSFKRLVNLFFALAIPIGAVLLVSFDYFFTDQTIYVGYALAFSAGVFLCVSLSDLLPELHFHQHDRIKLTVSLFAGLGLSIGIEALEHLSH